MVDANTIVAIAKANLKNGYDSTNSAGGKGYYTSTKPEDWCADFAKWVWAQAGVDVSGLTPAVSSFAAYGQVKPTPDIGDAVVFGLDKGGQHVAIVTEIDGGNIFSIGGDEGPNPDQPGFNTRSQVLPDGPYPSAQGYSSYWGMTLSGYVSPKGLSTESSKAPAVTVTPDAKSYVFWEGTGGALWQAFGPADGTLQGPYRLGDGPLGSPPTAGVDNQNRTFVYWKGTDGNLWEAFYNNGKWQGPVNHGFGPLG